MDNPDGDLTSLLIRVAEQADKAAFAKIAGQVKASLAH